MKRIILAVTNDLVHDQRMHRIAMALQEAGAEVLLVGRRYLDSPELSAKPYGQHRMKLHFKRGMAFYLEYQFRLWAFLMRHPADGYCAVDLDTILPVATAGSWHRAKRIYDAHEWFTEVPELQGRSLVRSIWSAVGEWTVPLMDACYTVGPALAGILGKEYGRAFSVVRNVPLQRDIPRQVPRIEARLLWYQGALNKGRGLEQAIAALDLLPEYSLWIAGEGDLSNSLRALVRRSGLDERVRFLGWVAPADLPGMTAKASVGLNLLEKSSKSYYYSLANKAFDYCQDLLPALHADFPEYRELEKAGSVGVLVKELTPEAIAMAVRRLEEPNVYAACQEYLARMRVDLVWETEKERLLEVYRRLQLLS